MLNNRGFGVIDVLATVSFMSLLLVIGGANLRGLKNDSESGSAQLAAFLKTARSKAISTTAAYRVTAFGPSDIVTSFGVDCEVGTPAYPDADLTLTLPDGAVLTDTDWEVCFTPRGLSDDTATLTLFDLDNQYKQVEVYLGGAVRRMNAGEAYVP